MALPASRKIMSDALSNAEQAMFDARMELSLTPPNAYYAKLRLKHARSKLDFVIDELSKEGID